MKQPIETQARIEPMDEFKCELMLMFPALARCLCMKQREHDLKPRTLCGGK